jgi:ribosome-associated protein
VDSAPRPAEASADAVVVDERLAIPRSELVYRATRSGGPGGQHVNTSSTRVELTWDVASSPSLTEEQRTRLLATLATRIDTGGVLRITEGGSRSQHRIKEAVTARLVELVRAALHVPKPRRKTRPTAASKEARLQQKRRRAEVKKRRGPVGPGE